MNNFGSLPLQAGNPLLGPTQPLDQGAAALQDQLFRYAQDLQELMSQQARLQQREQNLLQALGRGVRSDDLLARLVCQSSEVHLVTDGEGEITYASPQAARLLGAPRLELQGERIQLLAPPQQWGGIDAILAAFSTGIQQGAMQQRKLTLLAGSASHASRCYDALIMRGHKAGRTEIHWPLCREAHPRADALATQQYLLAFDDFHHGLMITDPQARIVAVNSALSRITGYDEAELIGQNPRLFGSGRNDPDFYRDFWQQLMETGSWTGELFNRRKNGQIFFEWLSVKAVKNAQGETLSYIAASSDMSPSEIDTRQLAMLAYHDPLTGLPNRRLFEDRLAHALAAAQGSQAGLCVLFLDLDRFKPINDEFGHEVGDQVLQQVSARLLASVRRGDLVARVGGDEFVILLQSVTQHAVTERIVQSLLATLAEPIVVGQHALVVGASVGAACYPQDGGDGATLLRHADAAMYGAKRFGTRFCFYETCNDADPAAA